MPHISKRLEASAGQSMQRKRRRFQQSHIRPTLTHHGLLDRDLCIGRLGGQIQKDLTSIFSDLVRLSLSLDELNIRANI